MVRRCGSPLLSREEECSLFAAMKDGDSDAREKLVLANLRLAFRIARKWHRLVPVISPSDLMQEASSGLLQAIDKFDPFRGVKFSTYAWPWINQAIRESLCRWCSIKIPRKHQDLVVKALKGRLWKHVGDPNWDTLFSDQAKSEQETEAIKKEEAEAVRRWLGNLPPRESVVASLFHGMDGDPITVREISVQFGISHQRVHQLAIKAMERLRDPDFRSRPTGQTFVRQQAVGSSSGQAKLTEDDIPEIWEKHWAGMSRLGIARIYGVSKSTINKVLARETWAHVDVNIPPSVTHGGRTAVAARCTPTAQISQ